jgi:hypothetical protein
MSPAKEAFTRTIWLYNAFAFSGVTFGRERITANTSKTLIAIYNTGNTKRGSITVPLTSCLTGLN